MGRKGDAILFASESCAIASVGGELERELEPGEIVVVEDGQVRSIRDNCRELSHMCIFEYIYFARPDSVIAGQSVHQARVNAGSFLAQEHPVEADLVIGVPDSGLDAAQGYAQESGIPYGVGFVKNRYVGRTFITPDQASREQAVRIKLAALSSEVEGKRVVIVDDSIVRGTTSRQIITLLREAGAKEVHMRISAPPFVSPCYFGTDIPNKDRLIACSHTVEEIRELTPGRTAWATSPWSTSTSWPPTPGAASARVLYRALSHPGLTGRARKNAPAFPPRSGGKVLAERLAVQGIQGIRPTRGGLPPLCASPPKPGLTRLGRVF